MPTSTAPMRLADHVRACRVGDQVIFLDLLRGRYVGVAGPQLDALSAAILGDSSVGEPSTSSCNPNPHHAALHRLHAQHLLSDTVAAGVVRPRPPFSQPVASLDADDDSRASRSDWHHLVRLWRATFVTSAWLRRHSLADIADRVGAFRAHRTSHGMENDRDAVLAAAATYIRLRPFALTSHDRCLNDSLALIHFLAGQGLFPQWFIGVRVHPFGAHSWVQSGDVVLNDQAERVRRYRPILVV